MSDLAKSYKCYHEITTHWLQVVPSSVLMTVHYEDLVQDTETEVRRMLDFVGLPFDEKCLHAEGTGRAVHTASAAQIREAPHARSIGRWRSLEKELAPLIEKLGGLDAIAKMHFVDTAIHQLG